jgi:Flp pilus assembly protein TadD
MPILTEIHQESRQASTAPRRLARAPDYRLLASRLLLLGNKQAAVAAYMAAAHEAPEEHEIHAALASLLSDLDQFDAAVGAGLLAVQYGPHNPRAHAELGRALYLSGNAADAMPPCATAVVLAPHNIGALVTFGAVLFTLGRHHQALAAAEEALMVDPNHFQARSNLALALEALGRIDEAQAQSRIALALQPDSPQARHNLAAILLCAGHLNAEAWRLYDGRLGLTAAARTLAAIPRWAGEDVAGGTVLLHAEQGFGDTIQFVRYAPMVAARGARVILAVQPALMRLARDVSGVHEVVGIGGDLPAHDIFCPLASLPGVFGTTIDSIPASAAYLAAPDAALAGFPLPTGAGLQVGLVWAGNPGFVHDRFRSMDGDVLRALQALPGVMFHSLQKGVEPPFPMQNRMPDASDFADTAAIINGLDLIIAVDTAVAHLAGAMGKPVWLLSRFMGCWRWLRDRSDSPWYPTMRIFRQPSPGDWASVLAEVRVALAERAAAA